MADIGALPTGGYSGAPTGGASLQGMPKPGGSECFVWGLFVLAAASEKENAKTTLESRRRD